MFVHVVDHIKEWVKLCLGFPVFLGRGEGLRLTAFCSLHRFGESLGEGLRDLRFTSLPSESLGDNLVRFLEESNTFVASKGRNDADVIRASDVIGDDVTGGSVIVTGADVLLVDVLRSNFVVSDVTGNRRYWSNISYTERDVSDTLVKVSLV